MTSDKLSGDAEDTSGPKPQQGIQSVEIAMRVLHALENGRGPMTLTQLAAACGMAPSKVHRYLVSLGRAGLIAQSPSTGRYDMGPALRRLGIESLRRMDEVALVSEHLPHLRNKTTHAINLAVWAEHGPVIVRWDYGSHPLPLTARVGATLPLLGSAIGRVFLAHLPPTLTEPLLREELAAGSSPVEAAEIEAIKSRVLREGIGSTTGGLIPGIASVAAPVFSAGDSLPLVVAVVMPARIATTSELVQVTTDLKEMTDTVSAELGHSPQSR